MSESVVLQTYDIAM